MKNAVLTRKAKALAVLLAAVLAFAGCAGDSPGGNASGAVPKGTLRPHTETPTPSSGHQLPVPSQTFDSQKSPDRVLIPAPAGVAPEGFVNAPLGEGLERYFNQAVHWEPCDTAYECARIVAPLDWAEPNGQAITLAVRRRPANRAPRLGSLFLNPGGPGGSAQDFVRNFNGAGLEQYDLVGVDPRGSGQSTPVVCGNPAETDAYNALDWSPDDEGETQILIHGVRAFAEQCRNGSGSLLEHVDSISTAYDFDLVRHLLGDEKLNYLGVSYGTWLGALYAELYPDRVGRMVLDSAVNITENDDMAQTESFERSLHNYAKWCASKSSACPIGTSEEQVVGKVNAFLGGLDAQPLDVKGRQLTQSLATIGLSYYFFGGETNYATITEVLPWAIVQQDGSFLLSGADAMNGRDKTGRYSTMASACPAISCIDHADRGVVEAFNRWKTDAGKAPVFGTYQGPNALCTLWSVRPVAQVKVTAATAPPIVVLGSTGDPATPYQDAQTMADQMASAVLVTREGGGHGVYDAGSACVNEAVQAYLVRGLVPGDGLSCPA